MHGGWRRADELLAQALDLAPDEREGFLERECAEDRTLRERVERLLVLADSRGAWLPTGGGFLPSDALPVQIGQTIAAYTVLAEIGAGGMGVVYRAHDSKLERDVVLKTLPTALASDLDALSRLRREARILASLQHPRIATVFGLEETDTQTFVVMELLEGDDLARRLENGRPFPIPEALPILSQIADALEAAHESSIIHRDLKPSNVILSPKDRVKVLDFGVAKAIGSDAALGDRSDFGRTPDGRMIGTPAYASPEQLRGREIDPRSDLFSFGVLAYELLTGEHPFRRASLPETLSAILNEDPVPLSGSLPDAPPRLGRLLERLLAKAPADRFECARDVRTEIEALRQESATGTPATEPVDSARRAHDRHDWSVAFHTLKEADDQGNLGAEDLERFGEAAYWTARIEAALDAWERAHVEYVRTNRPACAARVALLIAEEHVNMTATSVANGWLRRAEALLGSDTELVGHGYLARLRTRIAFEADGDLDASGAFAEQALAIAERFEDPDLRALAMQDRGRILVARDDVTDGIALIEEAMSSVLGGGLSPNVVGKAYCNMITACENLADYRRVGEWIDRAHQWCEPHSESAFPGICAVHHAEVMYARGAWQEAEQLAQRAAKDHANWAVPVAAGAFYVLGEIYLRGGAFDQAEAAFRRGHELGRDPVPGLALLRLAQGDVAGAQSLIARPLADECMSPLHRARLLPAAVEIALASGDTARAHDFVAELQTFAKKYDSPVFAARKAHARGITHLAEDKLDVALSCLQQACSLWKKADMPYHEARSRALLASGYAKAGDVQHAELEARTAQSVFERLHAAVDLADLETKLGELL